MRCLNYRGKAFCEQILPIIIKDNDVDCRLKRNLHRVATSIICRAIVSTIFWSLVSNKNVRYIILFCILYTTDKKSFSYKISMLMRIKHVIYYMILSYTIILLLDGHTCFFARASQRFSRSLRIITC